MYKGSDLIGKSIVSHDTGKIIDKVKDLVLDTPSSKVTGFVVNDGGVFTYKRVLPFDKIQTIGPDAVVVGSESAVTKSDEVAEQAKTKNVAKGTKVMSEDGRDLGEISDVFFNETSGGLLGYEVTGGVFRDAYKGKAYLSAPKEFRIGEDVAFVSNQDADAMESRAGGMKGVMQSASDKAGEMKEVVTEKATSFADAAKVKFEDFKDQSGSFSDQKLSEYVVGRRAAKTVRAENGSIIIPEGMVVTSEVVEQAKAAGAQKDLFMSVSSGVASSGGESISESASSASGALKEKAGDWKEKVDQVWDSTKEKALEFKDKAQGGVEDKRIKAALGKPVTKVILDPNDQPILKTGEVVTNHAVEQARTAGVLDMLLNAVYKDEPKFSSEELKGMGV
jgi:uncharacterized protein YrrD